jgi:hypothetical protein
VRSGFLRNRNGRRRAAVSMDAGTPGEIDLIRACATCVFRFENGPHSRPSTRSLRMFLFTASEERQVTCETEQRRPSQATRGTAEQVNPESYAVGRGIFLRLSVGRPIASGSRQLFCRAMSASALPARKRWRKHTLRQHWGQTTNVNGVTFLLTSTLGSDPKRQRCYFSTQVADC